MFQNQFRTPSPKVRKTHILRFGLMELFLFVSDRKGSLLTWEIGRGSNQQLSCQAVLETGQRVLCEVTNNFLKSREETKGQFLKSGFGECTLVPVLVLSFLFFVPSFRFVVPSFRFWSSRKTSAKTTLLETTLLRTLE